MSVDGRREEAMEGGASGTADSAEGSGLNCALAPSLFIVVAISDAGTATRVGTRARWRYGMLLRSTSSIPGWAAFSKILDMCLPSASSQQEHYSKLRTSFS